MRAHKINTVLFPLSSVALWMGFANAALLADDHRTPSEIISEQPLVPSAHYVIGSGDVLAINVWKKPEALVPAAAVRPDRMISVPIVKDVQAAGLTPVGAVNKYEPIDMNAPLTVLQAIAEAGCLNDYAKPGKIYILRKQNGKEVRLPFDYSAVIHGSHGEQNVALQVGDIVMVPQ